MNQSDELNARAAMCAYVDICKYENISLELSEWELLCDVIRKGYAKTGRVMPTESELMDELSIGIE